MSNGTVAVLGGGIAGLTAAHELMLRGFEVTVYEAEDRGDPAKSLGGKAATQFSPREGLEPLPGEHGFRFFPSFYRHVVETMRRIPLQLDAASSALGPFDGPAGGSVAERLIRSPEGAVARKGSSMTAIDRTPIDEFSDISTLVQVWTDNYTLPALDLAHLTWRLTVFYCSCNARREREWQKVTLWEFLGADTLSPVTQAFLNDMPKALAAMDAKEGNAKSMLNALFLWAQDFVRDRPADRILSGPTTKVWIEPWVAYIQSRGVALEFGPNAKVTGFTRDGTKILSAQTEGGVDIVADYFISALPLKTVQAVCDPAPRDVSSALNALLSIPPGAALRNMIGVQFFLNARRSLVKGLINYMGSDWGITSLSERQYWDSAVYQLPSDCEEVFSAIVTKLPINADNDISLSRDELKTQLLLQLDEYEGPEGEVLLDAAAVIHVHVDDGLEDAPAGQGSINRSPHLIHPPNFQAVRVGADIGLDNLFMAGDHVRSNTDLATMEGANETARRAVNCLLDRLGIGNTCQVVDPLSLDEPPWLKAIKTIDELRYFLAPSQVLASQLLQNEASTENPFHGALVTTSDPADATPRFVFDFARAKTIERRVFEPASAPQPGTRPFPGSLEERASKAVPVPEQLS
jgi:15-cis-phytoene desaturase